MSEKTFVTVAVLALVAYVATRSKPKVHGAHGARVGQDVLTHWYGPEISRGAFFDLVEGLRAAGITTAGEPPIVTCKLSVVTRDADVDVTFALVHDVEGEVRATVLDRGSLPLSDVWARIDQFIGDLLK